MVLTQLDHLVLGDIMQLVLVEDYVLAVIRVLLDILPLGFLLSRFAYRYATHCSFDPRPMYRDLHLQQSLIALLISYTVLKIFPFGG